MLLMGVPAAAAAAGRPRLPPARHRGGVPRGRPDVAGAAGRGRVAHRRRLARPGRELLVPGDRVRSRATPTRTTACRWWRRPTTGRPSTWHAAACRWPAAGSARTTSRRTRCSTETLTPRSYETWLRRTGVRYVFLPDDPLDYSARNEAALLRSGALGADRGRPGGRLDRLRAAARDADRHARPTASRSSRSPRPTSPCACAGPAPTGCGCATRRTGASSAAAACAAPREPWGTDLRVDQPGRRAPRRSTYGSAPSWARSSAARAAARARPGARATPPAPARPLSSGSRAGPAGAPTAARRATSRGRCGSR